MTPAHAEPRLSLVVSTTGRIDALEHLLESLQHCSDIEQAELIVVDQSPDRVLTAVLARRPLPCPLVLLTSSRGLSHGRNVGLAHARGALVAFPDDDCAFRPGTIRAALAYLDEHPDQGGLAGRQVTADGMDSALRWSKLAQPVTRRNFYRTSISSTLFLRRQHVLEVGGFDEALGVGAATPFQACEESDLVLRLLAAGRHIYYDPAVQVVHEDVRRRPPPTYVAKMEGYGQGHGYLSSKHSLNRVQQDYLLLRKAAHVLLSLLLWRMLSARADWAFIRGYRAGRRAYRSRTSPVEDGMPRNGTPRDAVSEVRSSYLWRFGMAGCGLLSTFAMTVLVVRYLSDRDASVYFAILAALFVGPLIGRLGIGQNAIRELAGSGLESGEVASRSLWTSGVLSLLTAPAVAWLSTMGLAGAETRMLVGVLVSVMIVLETVRLTASDVFAGLGHVGWSVFATHHTRSTLTVALFAMYLATAGKAPTLVDLLLISVGVGVCLLLLSLRRLSGDVVLHRPRHIGLLLVSARNGAVLAGVDLAAFVIGRGDVWLASYAFTPVDATSYSTASVLAFQITVPVGLATIALAPSVARLWSEDRISELRDLLNATATLSLAFTSAVVGVLWFVAPVAVTTLYGADLRSAALLLNVLSTGAIAIAAFGSSSILLIMTGHGRQAALAAVSSVVLAVPIGVLASHQGPLSLALASAAASPLLVVLQWLLARRLVGFAPTPSHRVDRAWEVLRRGQQSSEGTPA